MQCDIIVTAWQWLPTTRTGTRCRRGVVRLVLLDNSMSKPSTNARNCDNGWPFVYSWHEFYMTTGEVQVLLVETT